MAKHAKSQPSHKLSTLINLHAPSGKTLRLAISSCIVFLAAVVFICTLTFTNSEEDNQEQQAQAAPRTIADRVAPVDYAGNVDTLFQYDLGLYSGCEIVSLTLVLNSMGIDIDAYTIADTYIPYEPESNPQQQGNDENAMQAQDPQGNGAESGNRAENNNSEQSPANQTNSIANQLQTTQASYELNNNTQTTLVSESSEQVNETYAENSEIADAELGNSNQERPESFEEFGPPEGHGDYDRPNLSEAIPFDNAQSYSEKATKYYLGDPYSVGTGYPPVMAKAAQSILNDFGISSVNAFDITGLTLDELFEINDDGYPILVWTTTYYDWPLMWSSPEDGLVMYDNAHCVVLVSYDKEMQTVHLSDPLLGFVDVDETQFREIYDSLGCMAVVIC